MSSMSVEIVSAERALYSGEAKMLVAPATLGEVGIMPRHTPMLTGLLPGILKIVKEDGEEEFIYVAGGILEVQPDKVTVLADVAERGEDLDEARVAAAREAAEKALQSGVVGMDYAKAQSELAQAVAQLELLRKIRKR